MSILISDLAMCLLALHLAVLRPRKHAIPCCAANLQVAPQCCCLLAIAEQTCEPHAALHETTAIEKNKKPSIGAHLQELLKAAVQGILKLSLVFIACGTGRHGEHSTAQVLALRSCIQSIDCISRFTSWGFPCAFPDVRHTRCRTTAHMLSEG